MFLFRKSKNAAVWRLKTMQVWLFAYHDLCKQAIFTDFTVNSNPANVRHSSFQFLCASLISYWHRWTQELYLWNATDTDSVACFNWASLWRIWGYGLWNIFIIQEKSFIIVVKSTETFVFKNDGCSVDQRNQYLLKLKLFCCGHYSLWLDLPWA